MVQQAQWAARSGVGVGTWIVAIVVAALGLSAVASGAPYEEAGSPGTPAAARSGDYVDPDRPAARQVVSWVNDGQSENADVLRRIADQPSALWPTVGSGAIRAQVDGYTTRALAKGQGALLVLYGIPDRDCGGPSAGGADDSYAYVRYVGDVVAGLAGRWATVIVEPDAVPQAANGCSGLNVEERYKLIETAIAMLRAGGPVRIYLDAGNPGFVADLNKLRFGLERAGLAAADGFAVNVANFYTTAENVDFGERLSAATGGKHFVIDTSRNGNGPEAADSAGLGSDGAPVWCNPPGRSLGSQPTDHPGPRLVDAWLWVKNPGESDGSCRAGEPGAGAWFPTYALDLARAS